MSSLPFCLWETKFICCTGPCGENCGRTARSYLLVAVFYCLDALHGERRDRSILFWKSLPVSDVTTVMSKASIPLLVLPLLTFAITVALHWLMLLIGSAVLMGGGQSPAVLWRQFPLLQIWVLLFCHLVGVHALYYAPIYGWLLLVSAWARRAAFLWAGLPLLAVGVVEKIAFGTSHFADLLGNRIGGGDDALFFAAPGIHQVQHSTLAAIGNFLVSPGMWIGLLRNFSRRRGSAASVSGTDLSRAELSIPLDSRGLRDA